MAEEKSPSGDFAYLDANGGSHSKRSPSDNVGQQQRQQRHNNTALAQQRRKQHGDTSSAGVRAEGVAAHASTFVSPQRTVSPRGACSAGAAAFSKGAYRNCANAIDGFGIGRGTAGGSRAAGGYGPASMTAQRTMISTIDGTSLQVEVPRQRSKPTSNSANINMKMAQMANLSSCNSQHLLRQKTPSSSGGDGGTIGPRRVSIGGSPTGSATSSRLPAREDEDVSLVRTCFTSTFLSTCLLDDSFLRHMAH